VTRMSKFIVRTEKIHGLVFDGASFIGNILSFGFVPSLGDEILSQTGGLLLLLAVMTQMAGASWKRVYLGPRLAQRGELGLSGMAGSFMKFVLFCHFLLFTVISLMAFSLLGFYDTEGAGSFLRGDVWVVISLLVGGLCTYMVSRAGRGKASAPGGRSLPGWLEFGADGLLWVSVGLVTRIFWDSLVALNEPSRGIGLSSLSIVLVIAMSLLFAFFYLPSRYLFLVEDYRSGWTWVQVGAAMLPVVWMLFMG